MTHWASGSSESGSPSASRELRTRYNAVVRAPFGALGVRVRGEDALVEITFLPPGMPAVSADLALAREAVRQLDAYLRDPRIRFDLKVDSAGTEFQKRVWRAMTRIPAGETRTYGDLAREVGSTPRAVGQACGANPLPVVIPCHRVVAASGLGGFAHSTEGFLLGVKRWLLAHEARATEPSDSLFAHEGA